MCVLTTKYFDEYGWVVGKCRDRNYKPIIHIKQSFRNGVERILLWDEKTKWTEGVNEFGVGIINTTLMVKKDESEGSKSVVIADDDRVFYSPGGKVVRTALLEKTPLDALKKLIELEMEGFSCVFSENEAYILEAPFTQGESEYKYKYIKLDKDEVYVRTNHGIFYPNAGYPKVSDDPQMVLSRKSSESRYNIVQKLMNQKGLVTKPRDILKVLSTTTDKDPQMNPFRVSKTHGKRIMVTTGQVLIIPKHKTLCYRPTWSTVNFNFNKIDLPNTKTYFELVSSAEMTTQKPKTFKQFYKDTVKNV